MKNSISQKIKRFDLNQQANSFFYWLYTNFIFKHFFHNDLVQEYEAKEGIELALNFFNFLKLLSRKIIYLMTIYFLTSFGYGKENSFGIVFVLLTIIGSTLRKIINYDIKAYNNIMLMHVNPKDYGKVIINEYITRELSTLLIAFIGISYYLQLNVIVCWLFAFIYIDIHLIAEHIKILLMAKNNYNQEQKTPRIIFNWILLIIVGIIIWCFINRIFYCENIWVAYSAALFMPLGIYAYYFLTSQVNYSRLYRYNLNIEKLTNTSEVINDGRTTVDLAAMRKGLRNEKIETKKTGYGFLFDAFQTRYKVIMNKGMIIKVIIVLFVGIGAIAAPFTIDLGDRDLYVKTTIIDNIRFTIFIVYLFATSSKSFILSCFLQIDRNLVNYHFFRRTTDIAQNFKLRLKSVLIITLLPTVLMSILLSVAYVVHVNVVDISQLVVIVMFPIVLGVFYSVYNLSAYYLFQPYSQDGQVVNKAYPIVDGIIYFISYLSIEIEFKMGVSLLFVLIVFLVCVSLILYKTVIARSPKSFRVR